MLHIYKCSIIWHLSLSCLQPFPLKIDKSFTLRERQTLTSWNVICTSKTCVGFDTLMLQLQCSETFSRKLAVAGVWIKRDKSFEVSFNVNTDILLQNQYQRFDFFFLSAEYWGVGDSWYCQPLEKWVVSLQLPTHILHRKIWIALRYDEGRRRN